MRFFSDGFWLYTMLDIYKTCLIAQFFFYEIQIYPHEKTFIGSLTVTIFSIVFFKV